MSKHAYTRNRDHTGAPATRDTSPSWKHVNMREPKKQPKPIDGLTANENEQYARLCLKMASAARVDETVQAAMLYDEDPWLEWGTHSDQVATFVGAQIDKWQWALTLGRTTEQAVMRHIIGKIKPLKLQGMVKAHIQIRNQVGHAGNVTHLGLALKT